MDSNLSDQKTLRCCICVESREKSSFRSFGDYEYVQCKRCGLVFLKIDHIYSQTFYKDSFAALENKIAVPKHAIEYWSVPELYEKYQLIFHSFFYERLARMRSAGYENGRLLDVGCGYGFFIDYCKTKGIKAIGIDTEIEQIKWAQEHLGIEVYQSSVEKFQPDNMFEAVIMADVLEHIWDPNAALGNIYNFLKPKGLLVIQVPNVIGFKIPPNHSWGVPHHLWQFTRTTLKKLAEKNGYKILSSSTGLLGVIGMYERGGPTLKDKLYMLAAKIFHLGNRLLMICQKN